MASYFNEFLNQNHINELKVTKIYQDLDYYKNNKCKSLYFDNDRLINLEQFS